MRKFFLSDPHKYPIIRKEMRLSMKPMLLLAELNDRKN